MAKLFLSLDGNPVKEFRLTRSRTTIGRRPTNDIQIDNLAVSGVHVAIEVVGQLYFVEDQKSTNGTLLNGEPVSRQPLKSGDEIGIGKYALKFWREPAVAAKQAEFEKTMILNAPPVAPVSGVPQAVIRVLTGGNAGREISLTKASTSLGKAGLQVAVISKRGKDFYLAHIEGEQRPLVNSRPMGENTQRLQEEDLIEILGIRMAFFYR